MEIRTQDKLFVLVFGALAVAGGYYFGYRVDVSRQLACMSQREQTIVTEEDFPFEKQRMERDLNAARQELEDERKVPPPDAKVKGERNLSVAERERAVIERLRASGLRIVRSEIATANGGSVAALQATGITKAATVRQYQVSGSFPTILSVLRNFESELAPAIVSAIAIDDQAHNLWKMKVVF